MRVISARDHANVLCIIPVLNSFNRVSDQITSLDDPLVSLLSRVRCWLFQIKPTADHEAHQDQILFLSWLCLAQFDFTAMPFPPCYLAKCKVYSKCQKCRKTLKSTRGERSHLQQCCFSDFDQGNRLTGQESGAPDSCSSGSKRSQSVCNVYCV